MSENFVEMELREIQIVEDMARTQVIVLGEKEGRRAFPIFIGLNEAVAMDLAVRGEHTPRPLTHDLALNVITGVGATLERVLVTKLENDTFYGALELRLPDGTSARIDSRPSDAIVLATKVKASIFVEEQVLDMAEGILELEEEDSENDPDDDTFLPEDPDGELPF